MLSRVGIDTKVVAMPSATYFTQATDLKFSFMLLGWSTGTGEASSSLKALLMTFNRDKGYGTANRGPLLERQGRRADRGCARDRRRREARGVPAARDRARDHDTGIVPLHFQVNLWATRDGITYAPRTDENTLAWKFRPNGAAASKADGRRRDDRSTAAMPDCKEPRNERRAPECA
jgi:peptide/nickel transport system substrate-binding protein